MSLSDIGCHIIMSRRDHLSMILSRKEGICGRSFLTLWELKSGGRIFGVATALFLLVSLSHRIGAIEEGRNT